MRRSTILRKNDDRADRSARIRFADRRAGATVFEVVEVGYEEGAKTLFVWEGVTYYLGRADVDAVFTFFRERSAPGSAVVFDSVVGPFVDGDQDSHGSRMRGGPRAEPRAGPTSERRFSWHPQGPGTTVLSEDLWGSHAMTIAFGVTLAIGIGLGLAMGVPMGRFWERVRPRRDEDDPKRKKKKR